MTADLSPRQARFVEGYLSNDGRDGKRVNAAQAYRDAGYRAATDNAAYASASKLLRTPKMAAAIQARKVKLATTSERRTAVTHAWLVSEYIDTYRDARDTGDLTAARMTLDSLGKLTGLMVNRSVVDDSRGGLRETLSAMTFAQVLQIRDDLLAARALPALDTASVIDVDVVEG
jgi:hypothetical protein